MFPKSDAPHSSPFLRPLGFGLLVLLPVAGLAEERTRRVDIVKRQPGFVAFWDFVERDPADRRFTAHQPKGSRAATYDDFPLLGQGPFGDAIQIRNESDASFRPLLLVPRARLHESGLDVKGPGRSVTLVAWVQWESGNHAIAGIWHEGTDHATAAGPAARIERGQRQYALFAGLAANRGASAAHVSENGASSFGDRYARNLSVTKRVMQPGRWHVVGMVFDNARNTVTSYLDGEAEEYWIEEPEKHPFFQWPARGWKAGEYRPPAGKFARIEAGELKALRANSYWFPHDLYSPRDATSGGPFTIGRVIHMSRGVGTTGAIGGVAVYGKALSAKQMKALAAATATGPISARKSPPDSTSRSSRAPAR